MRILYIISLVLFIFGFFIKFNVSPKDYLLDLTEDILALQGKRKESLRERINKAKKIKKVNYIERIINETKEIMINNGTISNFNKLLNISIILCLVGIAVSIFLKNIFIMPTLIVLFGMIPFYYVKIQNLIYIDAVKKELESALSNITSSYMRYNTTFLEAVKENINSIRYPLKNSFKRYVFTSEHINSNNKENLEQLRNAINDNTYIEWVDGIIASEEDYNLKATLPNITNKFADMRIINNELNTKMYAPLKDFIYMIILTIISIPLFYLFNRDAVVDYLNAPFGKIEIAVVLVIILVVSIRVMQELKPAEYRN